MDVKSALLNEFMNEVYVAQPKGFEDLSRLEHVYKLRKYERLSHYLIGQGFERGFVDKALFIKNRGTTTMAKIYVDDIIFGSTSVPIKDSFVKLM
ncbi:Copia protein [Gossypium australe]|uniref:Copia protein n=1 Tax=Gossypium australe TaxID=47621 RepID=A0A5B6V0I9_9ROSI|nr:Copia protein [Gossypium australe]